MKIFLMLIAAAASIVAIQTSAAEDLVETAAHSVTFKTFLAAAKSAGLLETLKSNGPYTVFIPTDAAFSKLPSGTADALMKDKKKLAQVLAYHVVPGRITVSEV